MTKFTWRAKKHLARKRPRAAAAHERSHSPPAAAARVKTVCTIIITLSQHIDNYYTVSLKRWLAVQERHSISLHHICLSVNKRGLVCVSYTRLSLGQFGWETVQSDVTHTLHPEASSLALARSKIHKTTTTPQQHVIHHASVIKIRQI